MLYNIMFKLKTKVINIKGNSIHSPLSHVAQDERVKDRRSNAKATVFHV